AYLWKKHRRQNSRLSVVEVEDIDNLSRNQDIAVGLQVILKPRARPTPTWTSMPERTLDFEF
ncbi:hypothetical protein GW098_25545, partial [Escherichia coli]|nr:hypothetical protein [Escherichia coli]